MDEPGAVARHIIDEQLDDIARTMAHAYAVLADADGVDEVVTLLVIDGLRAQRQAADRSLSAWAAIIQPEDGP